MISIKIKHTLKHIAELLITISFIEKRSPKIEEMIRSLGNVKSLRVEGRMITQDIEEIYESETYKKSQRIGEKALSHNL